MIARDTVIIRLDGGETLMPSCGLHECPKEATHKVIWNPDRAPRSTEYYCETHAKLAAEEAELDEAGDLFLGPEPLE